MNKTLYILIFILGLFLLFSFNNHTEVTKPLEKEAVILAFGDSLTYGYNTKPSQSYPALLEHYTQHKVINAGISGETSKEGTKRIRSALAQPNIRLMILCMGGNDILQQKSLKQLKENLIKMITFAKEKRIQILLLSVPNFTLLGLEPLPLYQEVAEQTGVTLMNNLLCDILLDPSLKSDPIHPNAKGYKYMAKEIYRTLTAEGFLDH